MNFASILVYYKGRITCKLSRKIPCFKIFSRLKTKKPSFRKTPLKCNNNWNIIIS